MNRKRKTNIKDVAARAKVHPSTVSRVLNPATRSMVSNAVARRVEDVARQLGYMRSPMASGLRTGRSYTVGVLIPDLGNPIFPPIVRGIERTLGDEGYMAVLADSDNNLQNERAILNSLTSRHVDGLILATAHRKDAVVEACIRDKLPFVLVNRSIDGQGVNRVINNDDRGIGLAINHLLELGHQRIAFVGGPQNTSTGRDRYRAFRKRWRKGLFRSDPGLMVNCKAYSEAEGHAAYLALLRTRRKFTAVVAANDLLALGCCDALVERGLRCPGNMSVAGFNDTPFMDRVSPSLTTVRIPLDEMGVRAAGLLLGSIRDPGVKPCTIKLEPELVVRGSTDAP